MYKMSRLGRRMQRTLDMQRWAVAIQYVLFLTESQWGECLYPNHVIANSPLAGIQEVILLTRELENAISVWAHRKILNPEDLGKMFVWFEEMLTWRKERLGNLRMGCMTPGMFGNRTLGKSWQIHSNVDLLSQKGSTPSATSTGRWQQEAPRFLDQKQRLAHGEKFFFCILRIGANFSF